MRHIGGVQMEKKCENCRFYNPNYHSGIGLYYSDSGICMVSDGDEEYPAVQETDSCEQFKGRGE
jgi:hypothetical protein